LSEEMLALSHQLNPQCAHHEGDMRSLRLSREFDAVFVHDAVDYMLSEDELRQAITTAFVHCRPGAVAVFMPDETRESFEVGTEHGGSDSTDGRAARYLQWSTDPDPTDTWTQTDYVFLLRDADGAVRSVHETHRVGLFGRDRWLSLLAEAGFDAHAIDEVTTDDRTPREVFIGYRPA
jgi:trans-aconitate methyltransferase